MVAPTIASPITLERFESIKRHAKRTWEALRKDAEGNPFVQVAGHGYGTVIKGSVAPYIRRVSQEVTGHDCDDDRVDLVRKFLRYSHNVVVTGKVDRYVFDIFVRDDWNDFDAVDLNRNDEHPNGWHESRVTPEEAGEVGPPPPVTVSANTTGDFPCPHCGEHFAARSIGGHVASIHGGRVTCPECGREFRNPAALGSHRRSHRPKQPKARQPTKAPINYRVSDEGYTCNKCGYMAATARGIAGHLGMSHSTQEIACKQCDVVVDKPWQMSVHVRQAHRPAPASEPAPASMPSEPAPRLEDVPDTELAAALLQRLIEAREQRSEVAKASQRLDLIQTLVQDVNDGKIAPLRALGEIEEALRLEE